MKRNSILMMLVISVIVQTSACSPVLPQTEEVSDNISTIIISTAMTTNSSTSSNDSLPASITLGSILSGTGDVDRVSLTLEDFLSGNAFLPVDDGQFAIPISAAMPDVVLEGRVKISAGINFGYEVIRDELNYAADIDRFKLPDFDIQFVQDGSYLIPVTQGLVYTGHPYWNYIIGPGRIWKENGDNGYVRASFPFTLVERNQNCTHNGVMSFLFNGVSVTQMFYQITQETCLYFKFDLWGKASLTFQPIPIENSAKIIESNRMEVANRLPMLPLSALVNDYPESRVNIDRFGRGITRQDLTAYGLVINGNNYISNCTTRHGEYAFCENLRLPSYSTAKSAFAAVALMRLGQKYGSSVYDLLIRDFIPESRLAAGDWSTVTFRNALDMATGNYDQIAYHEDEESPNMVAFLDQSESLEDKIQTALHFKNQSPPGKVWVYHSSDTFLLTLAMNDFLRQQEGGGADIFDMVRDEVYIPIGLSAGALTSLRTGNDPTGIPFGGYGLFWTLDDIAKLSVFLNVNDGKISNVQILEQGLLHDALQKNPINRGLNTTGVPVFKYNHGFWAKEWTPSESRIFNCPFWTPFMSGYGGITVVLMPNESTYYYFSDNNEYIWYDAIIESNKLKPMCT